MESFDTSKSILQEIHLDSKIYGKVRLLVKRDDMIHDEVSGNKWRKLKYNVELARFQKKDGILTFGGAYSNHLLATASACKELGLKSVGIVRGEELNKTSNDVLKRCTDLGMDLLFIKRSDYDLRNEDEVREGWKERFPNYLLVPEGGANYHGMVGCQELWQEISEPIDHVFIAQGTTTTSCGVLLGMPSTTKLHVVPVLKGFDSLGEMRNLIYPFLLDRNQVDEYLREVECHADYHFGGYGKWTDELEQFIVQCQTAYHLPLDKVYTGKAFFGLLDWLKEQAFLTSQTILFIHTGGLKTASV